MGNLLVSWWRLINTVSIHLIEESEGLNLDVRFPVSVASVPVPMIPPIPMEVSV
jgi:hypothetical protein